MRLQLQWNDGLLELDGLCQFEAEEMPTVVNHVFGEHTRATCSLLDLKHRS